MKNSLETRLGLFVAMVVLAGVFILEIVGTLDRFHGGYQINAQFNGVQDLKKGDRVKMAGVDIGRVVGISLTNNKVLVAMRLQKEAIVKTDSTASIKFTGLMGQNYVSIEFGTPAAPQLLPGNDVPTTDQPDFGAIMKKIDNVATGVENLTKSFTGDKIDNLLGPFTEFLKANREPLTATIANIQAVSAQIAAGKGTVGRLINEDTLYNSALGAVTNLQDTAGEIKLTVAEARKVVDEVNAGHGTVGKLVKDEALYREATASMANLREILEKVNKGQGTVGKLVNDQEFLKNAKMTLQKLDKATEGLEDQGPLSVLGIVVSKLF
jgi:phospholipid/cholesterol/gamma-HCH transport system substrate-binding protein